VKRRILIALGIVVGLLVLLTVFVIVTVGPKISQARSILSGDVTSLSTKDISEAEQSLRSAHNILHGVVGTILGAVPIERQNINTVRIGVDETLPVISTARALRARLDQLQQRGFLHSGRISLSAIGGLHGLLTDAASSITSLVDRLRGERSGWLVPTVWSGLNETLDRAKELRSTAVSGAAVAGVASDMLGANGPRRYLVLLVNNAEVRPSGGIVSGIGLLTLDHGRVKLGAFHYYTDLAKRPYRRVAAPPDFKRRYERFNADTTRWVNVTLSPDTEEVAAVASRLYKVTAGKTTDGVLVVDPRGIASLLPRTTRVRVPHTTTELTPGDLPKYVYSTAYAELGGKTNVRHGALISLGQKSFKNLLSTSFGTREELATAASTVAQGHVRFISLHPQEEEALRRAGVTGALRSATRDRLFITETNFNGTKLDFWTDQTVSHTCDVQSVGPTRCQTTLTIKNDVPAGLTTYVAGADPYGELRNLIDLYLPADAVLQQVVMNGSPATFEQQKEDGLTSVGVVVHVLPGGSSKIILDYSLPPSDAGYSLELTPQPLTHDMSLNLALKIPSGWTVAGPNSHGTLRDRIYRKSEHLGEPQVVTVQPAVPSRGISALWERWVTYWHSPVF
jgi:hypothetical protein